MQKLSYENESHLHENEPLGRTHFVIYSNGFALRNALLGKLWSVRPFKKGSQMHSYHQQL